MLQLQTRLLLDVPRKLEDSRVRILRVFQVKPEKLILVNNLLSSSPLHCRYKENPNIVNESVHAQAREALKKYLHYFERVSLRAGKISLCSLNETFQWENHSRSLKLEAVTLEKIKNRITVSDIKEIHGDRFL